MTRSLWISKTGLDAQQTKMDVIANNLANVSTNGLNVRVLCLKICSANNTSTRCTIIAVNAASIRITAWCRCAACSNTEYFYARWSAAD